MVSDLSFFDHQCLQTQTHHRTPIRSPIKYPLRLLIAAECENTTATSLATTLSQFPDLIYLDLSAAQGARSPYVLRQIGRLLELTVLKMRSCSLRDEDLEHLSFGKKLRSLDVSYNFLSERGLTRLLELIPAEILTEGRPNLRSGGASPFARRYSGIPLQNGIKAESLEKFVVKCITSSVDGYLQVEEGISSTFTNLHLASNYMTVDGINKAIKHPTLRSLDCGSLNLSERPYELLSPGSPRSSGSRRFSDPPEIEILSPALFCDSFKNLRSLRINHSVVTNYPFSGKDLPISEICFELHSEDLRFELDSKEVYKPGTLFEMEDTSKSITPEPELDPPDSFVPVLVTHPDGPDAAKNKTDDTSKEDIHASFESPEDVTIKLERRATLSVQSSKINGSSTSEPITISQRAIPTRISISVESPVSPMSATADFNGTSHPHALTSHSVQASTSKLSTTPEGPETFNYKYKPGPGASWLALESSHRPSTPRDLIAEITQRQHRTATRERHPGRFKPSMLPHLKRLTLTDIPSSTRRRHIIDALVLFIQELAEEEELARLEERLKAQSLGGQRQEEYSPNENLRLRSLTLEMTSQPEPFLPPRSLHLSSSHHQDQKRNSFTGAKSSTEDPDSELFIKESESDFSFFGSDAAADDDLLVSEGRLDRPVFCDTGLMVDRGEEGHLMDVVGELAAFRKEKKARFGVLERVMREGYGSGQVDMEIALLGHWRGEVKVVR